MRYYAPQQSLGALLNLWVVPSDITKEKLAKHPIFFDKTRYYNEDYE